MGQPHYLWEMFYKLIDFMAIYQIADRSNDSRPQKGYGHPSIMSQQMSWQADCWDLPDIFLYPIKRGKWKEWYHHQMWRRWVVVPKRADGTIIWDRFVQCCRIMNCHITAIKWGKAFRINTEHHTVWKENENITVKIKNSNKSKAIHCKLYIMLFCGFSMFKCQKIIQ